MPFQAGGVAGVTTLSDLQIDVDKDWKAHGIYNLGDLIPKVDGAYSLGDSATQFDTVYGSTFPGTTFLSNTQIDTDKDWKAYGIYNLGDVTPKVDGAYNLGGPNAQFDNAYAHSVPGVGSFLKKTKSKMADTIYEAATDSVPASYFDNLFDVAEAADIAYQSELMPVKFADVFDHSNLGSAKARDIVYHGNFNLPSAEARDKVAESTYGMASDLVGVKGISKQVTEKRDFAFRTETPNHAYWHRMYNTPAAFETVYQDCTTSMQKKGTTPSKSAPNTADPNPQPGAVWSVSMIPDGTQVGGWAAPSPDPQGAAWDGTYLWLTAFTANYIYQVDVDGNTTGNGFASPGPDPIGAAWDGAYVWNVDRSAAFIYQLKTDGTTTGGGFAAPTSQDPRGLVWDGTYLWYADQDANFIYQLKTDGTTTGGGFAGPGSPTGLGWDGTYLWNTNGIAEYIYQLKTDGTQVSSFSQPDPRGVAWDGAYIWSPSAGASYVYQLGNAGNFDVNYRVFAK